MSSFGPRHQNGGAHSTLVAWSPHDRDYFVLGSSGGGGGGSAHGGGGRSSSGAHSMYGDAVGGSSSVASVSMGAGDASSSPYPGGWSTVRLCRVSSTFSSSRRMHYSNSSKGGDAATSRDGASEASDGADAAFSSSPPLLTRTRSHSPQTKVSSTNPREKQLRSVRVRSPVASKTARMAGALQSVASDSRFDVVAAINDVPHLRCLDWAPRVVDELSLGVGLNSGKIVLFSFDGIAPSRSQARSFAPSTQSVFQGEFMPKYARPCNAIRFNNMRTNQLAAGYEKVRAASGVMIFDIAHSPLSVDGRGATISPVAEIAQGESAMALDWVPESPSCVAVGTGFKWLRLYDLRDKSPISAGVMAHQRSVQGVRFDSYRPRCLATFSDEGLVKVWDVRKLSGNAIVEVATGSKAVRQVAWSPDRAGILATIASDEPWVSLWDINSSGVFTLDDEPDSSSGARDAPDMSRAKTRDGEKQGSSKAGKEEMMKNKKDKAKAVSAALSKPYRRRYTAASGGHACFAWQPSTSEEDAANPAAEKTSVRRENFMNRILTVSNTGSVEYISLQDSMPIAISTSGNVSFASNKSIYQSAINDGGGIASRMVEWCQAGYGANAPANASLFNTMVETSSSKGARQLALRFRDLWGALDRARILAEKESSKAEGAAVDKSAAELRMALPNILRFDQYGQSSHSPPRLEVKNGICAYRSDERSTALALCGMQTAKYPSLGVSSSFDDGILAQPRAAEHRLRALERAAMLAVFDGELSKAVSLLHSGVETLQRRSDQPDNRMKADTLHLAAIAVAGFPRTAARRAVDVETSLLWTRSCSMLFERTEKVFPMIHAALSFLVVSRGRKLGAPASIADDDDWFVDDPYNCVLDNTAVSVLDRIAFAVRYLPDLHLKALLRRYGEQATDDGVLEGLVITGRGDQGVSLLQAYLDKTADVQTAALVMSCSRSSNRLSQASRASVERWTEEYRALLNRWMLWEARARFDVAFSASNKDANKAEAKISVQCRYCEKSIYWKDIVDKDTKRVKGSSSMWLSKQGPSIRGCPSCKKPLPRCAICLLRMGSANPSKQIGVPGRGGARQRASKTSSNRGGAEASTTERSIKTWFTWCLQCRHGGHSQCLLEWFESHDTCPVSDCGCRCMDLDKM